MLNLAPNLQAQTLIDISRVQVVNNLYTLNGSPCNGVIFKLRSDQSTEVEFGVHDGMKHGAFTENFPGDVPKTRSNYVYGQLDGEFTTYSDEGKAIYRAHYVADKLDGTAEMFHPNGQLRSTLEYSMGNVKDGTYKELDQTGQILLETEYKDGRPTRRIPYLKGKIHGDVQDLRADGTVRSSCTYIGGKLNGTCTEYSHAGNRSRLIPYVDGIRQGPGTSFNDRGDTVVIEHFTNDTVNVSERFEYFSSGGLKSKVTYDGQGRRHGSSTTYWSNGEQRRHSNFDSDVENRVFFENENDPEKTIRALQKPGMIVISGKRHPSHDPCIVLVQCTDQNLNTHAQALKKTLMATCGTGRMRAAPETSLKIQPDYMLTLSGLSAKAEYNNGVKKQEGKVFEVTTTTTPGYEAHMEWTMECEDLRSGTRRVKTFPYKGPRRPTSDQAVADMLRLLEPDIRAEMVQFFPLEGKVLRVEKQNTREVKSLIIDLSESDGIGRKTELLIGTKERDGRFTRAGKAEMKQSEEDGSSRCTVEEGGDVILKLMNEAKVLFVRTLEIQ